MNLTRPFLLSVPLVVAIALSALGLPACDTETPTTASLENDYPPIAEKGLPAARRYAQIAPSAPHALHMPSHIFTRVGAWQDSVETNRRSADTAKAENSAGDQLHALDYLVYANLQLARDKEAAAGIDEARGVGGLNPAGLPIWYSLAAMPARFAVERGMWKEAAALEPRESRFAFTGAMTLYAKALGAARSGDEATAAKAAVDLADIAKDLRATKNDYWATEVKDQSMGAEAKWTAPADFRAFVGNEVQRLPKILADIGVVPQ